MKASLKEQRDRSQVRKSNLLGVLLLNLLFFPLMTIWIVVGILASPFCILLCKLLTGWDFGQVTRYLINIHGYGLIVIISPFVRFTGEGFKNITRPCIMVVNHLSFFDSYFVAALPLHDIIFAVGAWPFKMYWYTLFMRLARYMDVEQGDWAAVISICSHSFGRKGAVLFFPEGHRSRTGRLQPFYSGAFRLSKSTGVPIIPLCITGTDKLLPPGHFVLHPTQVRLKVLPPVDPAAFPGENGHVVMRRVVRELMEHTLEEMQGEQC